MASRMRRPNTNVYRSRLVYGAHSSSTNQPTTSRSSGVRRTVNKSVFERISGRLSVSKRQKSTAATARASGWTRITVRNGKDLSGSEIIAALEDFLKSPVHPFCISNLDNSDVTFYVRKSEEGSAILSASRRATTSSGRKLIIETQSASPPCIELVDSDKEVLKQVLDSLFCAGTHHLNLGCFSQNTVIRNHREYMPVNRNSVMLAIATLLSEQGGLIHSIDLSNNRLRHLDYLANLVSFTRNVIALDLNENQVDSVDELRKLSGWKLSQLNVKQNPFYKDFKSESEYHRFVFVRFFVLFVFFRLHLDVDVVFWLSLRPGDFTLLVATVVEIAQQSLMASLAMLSVFPQLTLLDGVPVVKEETVNFGLDVPTASAAQINWPPALGSFLVNDELKDLLIRFFMEYYSCFDSTETSQREKLLHAYTKTSLFSLTADQRTALRNLYRDSHNIVRISVWKSFRDRLVKRGHMNIVGHLSSAFPRTQHDPSSFLLDIFFVSGDLIGCCMNGSLKMISEGEPDVFLLFTRSFILRRVTAQGLCIENDMINVRNVSEEELRSYTTTVQNALNAPPQVNQQIGQITSPSVSNNTSVNLGSQVAQSPVAMGELLSRETNLRLEWAMKCLEDNGWQYNDAKNAFLRLLEQGNVPPQAFRN
ncbi:Nuclear RNA export factor 1 [Trichinella murrelli]|uniref:Nuclear RNA export factor 1 n=1 Tax=Trichinella murrelli TaxID=144512 RepID=A0A0V0UAK8_9BILA|nr:Nuclear RNA export factor 1 [Trichinella murrelli]